MLREFLSIFRSSDPLNAMGENFATMLGLTCEMVLAAGDIFVAGEASDEARDRIYRQDIKVNKLERTIRKQVIARLSLHQHSGDLPYCLFLLSLVKDVERLGDYAKNLTEVVSFRPGTLPEDDMVREIHAIRNTIDSTFREASHVVGTADRARALELIQQGRTLAKQCDTLIARIAASDYDARTAVAAALGTRYYKRIGGHLLNVLSSVVMPLHKLDYFDEDEVKNDE
ncbi:MAG TPA: PhoU domain-containing protein [Gemmatimonadales bacterium]